MYFENLEKGTNYDTGDGELTNQKNTQSEIHTNKLHLKTDKQTNTQSRRTSIPWRTRLHCT